ncbi:MAG: flagellar filament capping protein FliD [Bryobacteraceae bacterium]
MGTSSVNSTLASNLATIANHQTFTGVSTYSSDLQSVLSRSEQIAQIPVTALQNDQTTLQNEVSDLGTLQTAVGAMTQALTTLGQLSTGGALTATSTDSDISATVAGSGATAGTYTISDVTSLASLSSATMTNGVADPTSTAVAPTGNNTLYLVAGGAPVPITLTSQTNNLDGLEAAINSANAGVTASILTTSQGSYLTMTATQAGATTIQLLTNSSDPTTDLMTMGPTGSLAEFKVNGIAASSGSNQVTGVIPGITLSLNSATTSTESATITVAANADPITTALQNVVTQYNALAKQVGTEFGSNAGPLNGNSVVLEVQDLMRQFAFYTGTGGVGSSGVQSLSDLGISVDDTGQMSLDTSVVSSMSSGQLASALSFIGNSTTGLASLASDYSAYSDTTSGLLQQQITQDQSSEQNLQNQIDALNVSIAASQKTEEAKLEAADALCAQLESQQNMLTSTIQGLNYTLYGASLTNSTGA